MQRADVAAVLARCDLFASLPVAEIEAVAARSGVRRFSKDEQVFTLGEKGDAIFVVAKGSIAVSASNSAGREVVLQLFTAPESFGELAVLDEGPRTATATAREDTVLISVPGVELRSLFNRQPSVALALIRALSKMTRQVHGHSLDLVTIDLAGRVAKYLLSIVTPRPSEGAVSAVPVTVPLNQTELAQLVGGSRQHVNRVLKEFEAAGAIARRGARIVAIRPAVLEQIAADGAR